jgi:hypothetical protein
MILMFASMMALLSADQNLLAPNVSAARAPASRRSAVGALRPCGLYAAAVWARP